MNAITVRNLPPAVAKAVQERARKEKAAGAGKPKERVIQHDLDRFFGTWTKEEADAFDEALREQRQIDPEMWK